MRSHVVVLLWCLAGCENSIVAPGIDPSAMDRTADPCEDFYRYACGGFVASHVANARESIWRVSSEQQPRIDADLQRLFERDDASDPDSRLIRSAYDACLHVGPGDRRALDALILRIDALDSTRDLAPVLASLHGAGVNAFFRFGAIGDVSRPQRRGAAIGPGGLGLGPGAYTDPDRLSALLYRAHVVTLGQLGGLEVGTGEEVFAIERALAAGTVRAGARVGRTATHDMRATSALAQAMPHFDWNAYVSATGAPPFSTIDVLDTSFIEAFDALLATMGVDELRWYLRWRLLDTFAYQLSDEVVREQLQFAGRASYGDAGELARDKLCADQVRSLFSWTMARLYVKMLAAETKTLVLAMVARIRDVFVSELATHAWLDDESRARVSAKLASMRIEASAPDDFAPYVPSTIPEKGFLSQVLAMRTESHARSVGSIGQPTTDDWFLLPLVVNAAYRDDVNAVNLPAAILEEPVVSPDFTASVNYGALGSIIGHEMTHGFDNGGIAFDGMGRHTPLLSPASDKAFDERAQCVVEQYGAVEALPGRRIDGLLTLSENIADLGGIRLAYAALAPTSARQAGFSEQQTFFLAHAQSHCISIGREATLALLRADPHSPDRARVNTVVADTPEFAAAFSCGPTAALASTNRCAVW